MMSCRKFRALIDLYLDGEADDRQAQILFSHMEKCERCKDRFEEVKKLHGAMMSVSAVDLPDGFRGSVVASIRSEEKADIPISSKLYSPGRRSIGFFPVMGWSGVAAAILLTFAITLYIIHNPEPVLAAPEIHVVSPREDAVVEQQYVDVSAAFTVDDVKNVRVILDSKDVTNATEVNEDFLIYTSDELQSGYHMATVQITDSKGVSIAQRSWAFYIIRPNSI